MSSKQSGSSSPLPKARANTTHKTKSTTHGSKSDRDHDADKAKREYDAECARLDRERRQQSSQAARKALELQKQAHDLTQAALATADADERQKLLSQALNKLIEAGALGKVAKYLTTGTCQGMLFGGGLGTGIGISLGTLVGVLVGGVTSLVLGGLGTGIGALAGVLHGPFFKPGEVLAKGVGKVTGTFLPDWKASPEQKYRLEKMIGQANELDRPTDDELEALTAGDGEGWLGEVARGQGPEWTTSASWFPGKGYVTSWIQGDDGKAKATVENEKGEKKDVVMNQAQLQHALVRNSLHAASPGAGRKANAKKSDGAQGSSAKREGKSASVAGQKRLETPAASVNGSDGRPSGAHEDTAAAGEQQKPARKKPAKLEVRSRKNASDGIKASSANAG